MLATLSLATAVITLPCLENAADGHSGPSSKRNAGYTKFCSGYTTGYTNYPQNGAIVCPDASWPATMALQNEAAITQWIKVKVKKRMVGMERFELSTS